MSGAAASSIPASDSLLSRMATVTLAADIVQTPLAHVLSADRLDAAVQTTIPGTNLLPSPSLFSDRSIRAWTNEAGRAENAEASTKSATNSRAASGWG